MARQTWRYRGQNPLDIEAWAVEDNPLFYHNVYTRGDKDRVFGL